MSSNPAETQETAKERNILHSGSLSVKISLILNRQEIIARGLIGLIFDFLSKDGDITYSFEPTCHNVYLFMNNV